MNGRVTEDQFATKEAVPKHLRNLRHGGDETGSELQGGRGSIREALRVLTTFSDRGGRVDSPWSTRFRRSVARGR